MLIEFSTENFKSIKNKMTLTMQASFDKSLSKNVAKVVLPQIEGKKNVNRVLKTSIIYGANASGKSNLLKAMNIIRKIIIHSNTHQPNQAFPIDNFRLDLTCSKKPTKFEFIFIQKGIKYAYQVVLTSKKVIEECLYYWPNGRQVKVFEREGNNIVFGGSYKAKNKEDELRNKIYAEDTAENILFLSMANKVNIQPIKDAFTWFAMKLVIINRQNGIGDETTRMLAEHFITKQEVLNYLKVADSKITDFTLVESDADLDANHPVNNFIKTVILPEIARKENIKIEDIGKIVGKSYNEKIKRYGISETGERILVDFDISDESDGTQRYYGLIGPIISCLKRGCTVLYDELELRLHPLLAKGIIELFTSDINKNDAQLIITSHNVNLLDTKGLFRKDQIWFTEKNEYSETELYSLDDITGVRHSMIKAKNYLKGSFGAIPDLNWEEIKLEK